MSRSLPVDGPRAIEDARETRRRSLGAAIRTLRAKSEMTQTDLGNALAVWQPDRLPIPQSTISRWESGATELTLEQVFAIEESIRVKHGTLSIAGGYSTSDFTSLDIERLLLADSNMHPEMRDDFIRVYRSYVKSSRSLSEAERRARNMQQTLPRPVAAQRSS
jgi:transcriptional regulator with XRE-family HTH domain